MREHKSPQQVQALECAVENMGKLLEGVDSGVLSDDEVCEAASGLMLTASMICCERSISRRLILSLKLSCEQELEDMRSANN